MTHRAVGFIVAASMAVGCADNLARPSKTEILYTCGVRDRLVAEFLATKPELPTITELRSGEKVYIDWLERVYHHSGPECVNP